MTAIICNKETNWKWRVRDGDTEIDFDTQEEAKDKAYELMWSKFNNSK